MSWSSRERAAARDYDSNISPVSPVTIAVRIGQQHTKQLNRNCAARYTMRRQFLFEQNAGEPSTFANDEHLPPLPLPTLDETLARYYESLRPFGTAAQLATSRRLIDTFRDGIGQQLHALVEQRARRDRNWVEHWWEDYAYCTDRSPVAPFSNMLGAFPAELAGWQQTREGFVRGVARVVHCSMEYWDLIRHERMRPSTNPSGTVTFSSFLLKRLFNTCRIPGERMDRVVSHFRTVREVAAGALPERNHTPVIVFIGKGRIFAVEILNERGEIRTVQEMVPMIEQIVAKVELEEAATHPVPVLTCDNRTSWAQNRDYLRELTPNNAATLQLIESSLGIVSLDQHQPADYNELCLANMAGDMHSRWADSSCTVICYPNGRMGCGGEHACYDGTISMAFMVFVLLTMLEEPEPDWAATRPTQTPVPRELHFDVDERLRGEVQRVWSQVRRETGNVMANCTPFVAYGKALLKEHRLHPDSYVQMMLQLVYYRMHGEFVATYETALMRDYYNGRTETLRSCNVEATEWVRTFLNPGETDANKVAALRRAVDRHSDAMADVRHGKGFDRHLFGMWCAAYEADLPIPELYDDELYKKSGGGGNFILSTSTLGYSLVCGYVVPMCRDGYGLFYSITDDIVFLHVIAYRDSDKTSVHRFARHFEEAMLEVRDLLERTKTAKL